LVEIIQLVIIAPSGIHGKLIVVLKIAASLFDITSCVQPAYSLPDLPHS